MSIRKSSKYFKKLEKLATLPIDLRSENLFSRERVQKMSVCFSSFQLFYALEKIDPLVFETLLAFAKEQNVLEKMKEMQEGKIVNFSQNLPALHTAVRDFFEPKIGTEPTASQIRFQAEEELKKLKTLLPKILDSFDHLVQIGIGGSELGPKALYEALSCSYKKEGKKVSFISNIDPDPLTKRLKEIDLKRTLFVTVSKSGSTPETAVNDQIIRSELVKHNLLPEKQMIVVTEKNSSLDLPKVFLERFYIPSSIGGRFSSTSMAGGVALSFGLGFENFLEILKGAHAVDRLALEENVEKNIPLLMALFSLWNHTFLKIPCLAVLPYDSFLDSFWMHLQQLFMESNGKEIDIHQKRIDYFTAPILLGGIGTNFQHSFGQLLHQGTQSVALEFIASLEPFMKKDFIVEKTSSKQKSLANLFAQAFSLAFGNQQTFFGNRPSHILLLDTLNPYTMGGLLALFEHKAAFEGFLWNINSFDQPGVELGKKLAKENLALFKKEKKPSNLLEEKMMELLHLSQ